MVSLTKGPGQLDNPDFWLDLKIPPDKLKVLQTALDISVGVFYDGGCNPKEDIDFLRALYDEIKEKTGIAGEDDHTPLAKKE